MRLVGLLKHRHWNSHVLRQSLTALVIFHDAATGVVFAMPDDLIRSGFVQNQAEWWLVLPHLACNVVATAKLVCEAFALLVQNDAANAAQGFSSQELNLCIGIIRLDEASRMHLNPFKVDGLGSDGFAHLDAVASAMFPIRSWQMHQIRTVFGQQGVRGEISTKATSAQDDRTVLLKLHASLFVNEAYNLSSGALQQLRCFRLSNDTRLICGLGYFLDHLD
mmetsp:Transcript_44386/g.69203  ORF Transcript_44386/g.69203 Transcript_44386/m.69203 type:complete len:221 (+) Transcript_44386:404-1066(+)